MKEISVDELIADSKISFKKIADQTCAKKYLTSNERPNKYIANKPFYP